MADLSDAYRRGVSLKAAGKRRQALRIFEQVIADTDRNARPDLDGVAVSAWQMKCQIFMQECRWPEVLETCDAFLARYSDRSDFGDRWAIGDVRCMQYLAHAAVSRARTGTPGPVAEAELDVLIEWLRAQPEANFRTLLAERLVDKMRWHVREDEGLDALDELVDVLVKTPKAVLAKLDGGALTLKISERIVQEAPQLLAPDPEDQEFLVDAAAEMVEQGESVADVLRGGVSSRDTYRMIHIGPALARLSDLVGRESSSPEAAELAAVLAINSALALARLGRADELEILMKRIAARDRAAIAACDRIVRDAIQDEQDGHGISAPAIISVAGFKARVHELNGRRREAVAVLDEVIDTFSGRDDPVVAAGVDALRELRDDLRSRREPATTAIHSSPSSPAQIVWRMRRGRR